MVQNGVRWRSVGKGGKGENLIREAGHASHELEVELLVLMHLRGERRATILALRNTGLSGEEKCACIHVTVWRQQRGWADQNTLGGMGGRCTSRDASCIPPAAAWEAACAHTLCASPKKTWV